MSLGKSSRGVNDICPNCGREGLSLFYEVCNVPVHSCVMMSTQQEALDFPCGDVALGFCDYCGFITNTAYDPATAEYAAVYEDQQSFSPTFNRFARNLAKRLVEKHNLFDKEILEIGCGKGDFLVLLCELGGNRGVGIDPSAVAGRVHSEAADRVVFINEHFSEKHAKYVKDFVCCRHTLEHIHSTAEFLRSVRESIGDRTETVVFFEVPDTVRVLTDLAFEDIYYEHCSYFTPGSLACLFRACRFEITDLSRDYGDQYLLIEARPVALPSSARHPLEETVAQLSADVREFAAHIEGRLRTWKAGIDKLRAANKEIVVWGSGSKCVAFITTLGVQGHVRHIVDINPHRHGKFIPGIGKEIMPPEILKASKPDLVIAMNPIYKVEIAEMLDKMGVAVEITAL